jgi:hypothetical protein
LSADDIALAELLESRHRALKIHTLIAAHTFTHLDNPDDLSADFYSQVVMTAALQVILLPTLHPR